MLCALIMSGGKGTRFWPLSTENKPKQFLNLIGDKTMLQMTVDRILEIIPMDRIFICTGQGYVDLVKEQIPELQERNIIIEPEGRNTAPCIALSSLIIQRYYNNATMLVLPSDHLIRDEKAFRELVVKYDKFLNHNKDGIVTFGITPNRPETGYGYIKTSTCRKFNFDDYYEVNKFVEKPNVDKAIEYLSTGNYFWNSGMFMWKIPYIIEKIKEHIPNTYEILKDIEHIKEEFLQCLINERYSKADCISIDYGILEKESNIFVVPSNIGWDDVGSWEAIERYTKKDSKGNIHIGQVSSIETENNLIIAANQNIIVDGVSDIYVIENEGKIIVGKKNNVSSIKALKNII